jgi:hypothetical protein
MDKRIWRRSRRYTRDSGEGAVDTHNHQEKEKEIHKITGEGKGDTQDHWRRKRKRRYTRSLEKEKEIHKVTWRTNRRYNL